MQFSGANSRSANVSCIEASLDSVRLSVAKARHEPSGSNPYLIGNGQFHDRVGAVDLRAGDIDQALALSAWTPAPGFPTSIIGARALPSLHASFRRSSSVFVRVDGYVEY